MKRVNLFGISVDPLTTKQTVELVRKKIVNKVPTHLLGMNADKVNGLGKDKQYDEIVKNADIINADGVSLIMAAKFLNKSIPERVAGIDLMQDLLEMAEKDGFSVYFLGAKHAVVSTLVDRMKGKYPQLQIVGYRDGYFGKDEWQNISNELKEAHPDLVFIGISSPTKEYLIDYFMKQGNNAIFMGVGGSFDVLSGYIKRAPKWVRKTNMEWMYRFLQEPKRLFKRYFFGNVKFLISMFREKFKWQKQV